MPLRKITTFKPTPTDDADPDGLANYSADQYSGTIERYLNASLIWSAGPPPTPEQLRRWRRADQRRRLKRWLTPIIVMRRSTLDRIEHNADIAEMER